MEDEEGEEGGGREEEEEDEEEEENEMSKNMYSRDRKRECRRHPFQE